MAAPMLHANPVETILSAGVAPTETVLAPSVVPFHECITIVVGTAGNAEQRDQGLPDDVAVGISHGESCCVQHTIDYTAQYFTIMHFAASWAVDDGFPGRYGKSAEEALSSRCYSGDRKGHSS